MKNIVIRLSGPFLLLLAIFALEVNGATPKFEIDTSEAQDLTDFGNRVKKTCENWYPKIARYLMSPGYKDPETIRIRFDPNDNGVAGTDAFQAYIQGGAKYFREHQDDLGAMVHETVHVVQRYRKCEGWITEGVADMIRWFRYEPANKRPGKPNQDQNYRDASPYFLDFVDRKVKNGRRAIQKVNRGCREGNYDEQWWKQITGMTLDDLWAKMQREG